LGKKVILVLDEASMVGTRQFNELLGHTEAAKTKLVGVGDRQQLPAIEAGRPFPALGDRLGQAELTDIQRQHTPWMREMVKAFAEGRVADALRELAVRERIHVADTPDAAQRELITHWHSAGKPKDSLILTSTHEDVDGLNRMAQAKRLEEGDIAGKSVAVRDERFFVGDRVVFEERSKIFGVENGSLGPVVGVRTHALGLWDDLLTVELDNRKQVHIPLKHYSKVGLGYAMTTHSAQGQTTQNAFVFVSGLMQTLKSSYVQASRPKENAHFFMDQAIAGEGLDDLLSLMSKKDDKLMASDLVARPSAKGSAQSAKAQAAPDPHETPDHDGHSR